MQMQMHYSLGIVYCTRMKAYTVYDWHSVFCIGKMQPLIGVSLTMIDTRSQPVTAAYLRHGTHSNTHTPRGPLADPLWASHQRVGPPCSLTSLLGRVATDLLCSLHGSRQLIIRMPDTHAVQIFCLFLVSPLT
jgi:hypothetical protein